MFMYLGTIYNNLITYLFFRKRSRSTMRQTEALVDIMMANRDLALGRFVGPMGHENNEHLWGQVAEEISALGPAKNSVQIKTVSTS